MAKKSLCFPHDLKGEFSSWVDAVEGLPLGWTTSEPVEPMLDALDALDNVAKKALSADLKAAEDAKTYLRLKSAPLRSPPSGEVDKKGLSIARKLNGDTFWSSLKTRFWK